MEQLSKLPHAPSVGLHDVPSESLGVHLGVPEMDELDEEVARKFDSARVVLVINALAGNSHLLYRMQMDSGTTTSESSEEDDDDSSSNSNRKSKKRMSIMTNQYQDVSSKQRRKEFEQEFDLCSAGGASTRLGPQRRKFFQSGANWNQNIEKVLVLNREVLNNGGLPHMSLKPARKHIWLNGDNTDDPDDEDEYDGAGGGQDMDVDGYDEETSRRPGRSLYY